MKLLLSKLKCTSYKYKKFHRLLDTGRKDLNDRLILTPHLNVEESEPTVVKGISQGHVAN